MNPVSVPLLDPDHLLHLGMIHAADYMMHELEQRLLNAQDGTPGPMINRALIDDLRAMEPLHLRTHSDHYQKGLHDYSDFFSLLEVYIGDPLTLELCMRMRAYLLDQVNGSLLNNDEREVAE